MLLELIQRPLTVFNPADKEHRQHYAEFLRTGSWGSCPVRFAVTEEESNNNLAYAMQRLLVDYYVGKEFALDKFANN